MTSNPTLSNGRYEVFRCIGKGGMAAVFLARDNVLQIERAIKVLKPEYMVRNAAAPTEAVAMARLSHPNGAGGSWAAGTTGFIVMEWCPMAHCKGISIPLDCWNTIRLDHLQRGGKAVKLAHDLPHGIPMAPSGGFGPTRISEPRCAVQTQVMVPFPTWRRSND